jgi:hypothetical protein
MTSCAPNTPTKMLFAIEPYFFHLETQILAVLIVVDAVCGSGDGQMSLIAFSEARTDWAPIELELLPCQSPRTDGITRFRTLP